MKKLSLFGVFGLFLILITLSQSCKKRNQPRMQWLIKPHYILSDTKRVHEDNLKHIDDARTTMGDYQWGDSTISLSGPAGYSVLSNMAASEFAKAYQKEMMPDTLKLTDNGVTAKIVEMYAEERRNHDADKAYKKIRIAVEKKIYEDNTFFSEAVLWFLRDYVIKDIGGSSESYAGVRSLEKEKYISKLVYSKDWDNNDPWGCNCSPKCYMEDFYKKYAEGDVKSLTISNSITVVEISLSCANVRFKNAGYGGDLEDYKTKYDPETESYYVDLDF